MYKKEKKLEEIITKEKLIQAPNRIELVSKHYEVIVGIGNNHTARILIDEDALIELRKLSNKGIEK